MLTGLVRTSSENKDFVRLVRQLDAELAKIDGSEHSFYAQYNKIDNIDHVVLYYVEGEPVACGAIKKFSKEMTEIKRMFTVPYERGKGLATLVLLELEKWASELRYAGCILETGKRQPDAIALYEKNGYKIIENYGQYAGVENSVCFGKQVNSTGISQQPGTT